MTPLAVWLVLAGLYVSPWFAVKPPLVAALGFVALGALLHLLLA
jgi:hypothetical protein